ncbi:hypothetical protein D9613_009533 [Agrocybe pediades]|uniref:Uncharacterized protein n=1 Tax=Agrocybe pediades TaxID=84607 RepID=A0A8H4R4N9_9AGAR|nr:hypothetical protein D9613_009533 [Agrocybe pediades]
MENSDTVHGGHPAIPAAVNCPHLNREQFLSQLQERMIFAIEDVASEIKELQIRIMEDKERQRRMIRTISQVLGNDIENKITEFVSQTMKENPPQTFRDKQKVLNAYKDEGWMTQKAELVAAAVEDDVQSPKFQTDDSDLQKAGKLLDAGDAMQIPCDGYLEMSSAVVGTETLPLGELSSVQAHYDPPQKSLAYQNQRAADLSLEPAKPSHHVGVVSSSSKSLIATLDRSTQELEESQLPTSTQRPSQSLETHSACTIAGVFRFIASAASAFSTVLPLKESKPTQESATTSQELEAPIESISLGRPQQDTAKSKKRKNGTIRGPLAPSAVHQRPRRPVRPRPYSPTSSIEYLGTTSVPNAVAHEPTHGCQTASSLGKRRRLAEVARSTDSAREGRHNCSSGA